MKPNKFKAIRTTVDGMAFDSKGEARRYSELRLLEKAGIINRLERQVEFQLMAHGGEKIGKYVADFSYVDGDQKQRVVEDFKSPATAKHPLFVWKRKHMKAQYGIEIKITGAGN